MPQRRTLSRHQPDPGQGPLPIIIRETSVVLMPSGIVRVTWPQPMRLLGLPPFTTTGAFPLTAASQNDEFSIDLSFAGGTFGGDVITLPDWTPSIRGFNGEWAGPIAEVLGGTGSAAFPNLVVIESVTANGSGFVMMSLSSAFTATNAPEITVGGFPSIALNQIGPTQLEIEVAGSVGAGDVVVVGAWVALNYAPMQNAWIAPYRTPAT